MDLAPSIFVGRQAELAVLGKLLLGQEPRLLAITGPAGVGKSRLALQTCYRYGEYFDGETCFLSLQRQAVGEVALATAAARGLLVLDGIDYAPDHGRALLELLPGLRATRVLVTARQAPLLPGLVTLRLDGLPVPPVEQARELGCNASVALYLAAARQHNPAYQPGRGDLRAIAARCRAAQGLPAEIIRAARSTLSPGAFAPPRF